MIVQAIFHLTRILRRLSLPAVAVGALVLLAGCASAPHANPSDPFEPFNRHVATFNEGVDSLVLKPVAITYKAVLPAFVQTGVSNFFGNLSDAWSFVNSALQLKGKNAGDNLLRFNINTLFGLGGLIDIASDMNIERHKEDFGQTLGHWGVPPGPYIVLPLLGPSTLRDTLALPVDRKGDFLHSVDPLGTQGGLYLLRVIDVRSNLLRTGTVLDEVALDKYSFIRDAYLQRRRASILGDERSDNEGREPPVDGDQPSDSSQPPVEKPAAGQEKASQ